MTLAYKLTTKALTVLPLALALTSCGTLPPPTAASDDGVRRATERPHVFGRHAWDRAHAGDASPDTQTAQAAPPQPAPAPQQTAAATTPVQPAPVQTAEAAPPAAKPKGGLISLFSWPKASKTPKASPAAPTQLAQNPEPSQPTAPAAPPAPQAPVQVAAAAPQPVAPTSAAPTSTVPAKPKRSALFAWPKTGDTAKAPQTAKAKSPPIVGGYGPATDKQAVAAAAEFAVGEEPGYKFSAVYSAKVQVVAGTNYSLCLWVRRPAIEPNPFSRRMVAVTVFQGLDQHYEVVSWREVEHCRS